MQRGTNNAQVVMKSSDKEAIFFVDNPTPYTYAGTLEGTLTLVKAGAGMLRFRARTQPRAGSS